MRHMLRTGMILLIGLSAVLQAQLIEAVDITDILSYEDNYGPWIMDQAGNRIASTQGPDWADYQFYRWNTSDFAGWQDWMVPSGYGSWVDGGTVSSIEAIAPNGTAAGRFTWPEVIYDADGDTIPDTLFDVQMAAVADAGSWGTWIPLGRLDDSLQWGSNYGMAKVISADGNVAAGIMSTYSAGNVPFVFHLDSMRLDTLPRLQYGSNSVISGINEDGTILIGSSNYGWSGEPFIWTQNADGGYDTTRVDSPIVDLANGQISADGRHIIGMGEFNFTTGQATYLMTEIDGQDTTIQLPGLPGLLGSVGARSIANDGTVFGLLQEAGGPWGGPMHAYMYHHEGGAVDVEAALTALGLQGPPPQTGPLSMVQVLAADTTGKKLYINYQNDFWEAAYYWVVLPDVAPPVDIQVDYTDGIEIVPGGIDLSWENVLPYAYSYRVEYRYQPYGAAWGDWIELATGLADESFHQDIAEGGYYSWRVTSLYGADESVGVETPVYEVRRFADAPTVIAVTDVPEDQGGKVIVSFIASGFDILGGMTNELYTVQTLIGETWVAVATTAAYGIDEYAVQVNTINDSVDEGTTNAQAFRVVAALDADVFISEPMSGYSVDNIAPPAPAGVIYDIVSNGVELNWAPLNINDLGLYRVYRGTNADMTDAEMIGEAAGTNYTDETVGFNADVTYYYQITGLDIHENEGEGSAPVQVTIVSTDEEGLLPEAYALGQNYPNPFNPNTRIDFALPEAGNVTLIVYDLTGREVVRLVDRYVDAGYQTAVWTGVDQHGSLVPTGMYVYRLQSGSFQSTKRMLYLK